MQTLIFFSMLMIPKSVYICPNRVPLVHIALSNLQVLDNKWAELTDLTVDGVPSLNLCLLGPIGSGKSAFINSVLSEFYQRIVTTAFTGCSDAHTPNTTSVSAYRSS
jgi:ABC-type molybdenum transport system ATPase subunit/photorepair protein PhrA